MRAPLARVLCDGDAAALGDVSIVRTKYKPGKNCLVLYRMEQSPGRAGAPRFALVRFYETGGAARRLNQAAYVPASNAGSACRAVLLEEYDALAWLLPHERKLRHLPALSQRDRFAREVLPELVTALRWTHGATFELEPVHYTPEHSCCVRLTLRGAADQMRVLYGKTYADAQGARTGVVMQALDAVDSRARGFATPRALAYLRRTRSLWQEAVPGLPALSLLRADQLDRATIGAMARSVAAFHRGNAMCRPPAHLAGNWSPRQRVLPMLGIVAPLLVARARAILDACDAHPERRAARVALVHGDLHLQNLLIAHDSIHVIDLDNVRLGDPLDDLATLFASLLGLAIAGRIATAPVRRFVDEFLAAYRHAAGVPPAPDELARATAQALVEQRVFRAITRLKDGRPAA
ncbi:MAG: phosphotransferase, partial [Gammaproteobacteria bacterium]